MNRFRWLLTIVGLLIFVGCFVNSVEQTANIALQVNLENCYGGGNAQSKQLNTPNGFSQLFYLRAKPQVGVPTEAVKLFTESMPPLSFEVAITVVPNLQTEFFAVAFRQNSETHSYDAFTANKTFNVSTTTENLSITLFRIKDNGSVRLSLNKALDCTLFLQERISKFRVYSCSCSECTDCTITGVPATLEFVPVVCLTQDDCVEFDNQIVKLNSNNDTVEVHLIVE